MVRTSPPGEQQSGSRRTSAHRLTRLRSTRGARSPTSSSGAVPRTARTMPEQSTTPDLVEVVTGLFEAADRGDWDAVLSAYAPYAVLETADGIFDAVSPARMRGFWEEVAAMFEDFAIKVETVVDLGNGIVYSIYRAEG